MKHQTTGPSSQGFLETVPEVRSILYIIYTVLFVVGGCLNEAMYV